MNYDQIKIDLIRMGRNLFTEDIDRNLFVIICYVEINEAYKTESNKQVGYLINKYKGMAVDKVNRIIDKDKLSIIQFENYTLKEMKQQ